MRMPEKKWTLPRLFSLSSAIFAIGAAQARALSSRAGRTIRHARAFSALKGVALEIAGA